MNQLLSKLVAGGLSAAVILIWWPRFFPVDDVETWLARGVVWTLSFELLLHALAPLERALWHSPVIRRVRSRLVVETPRVGVRGRGALACAALAVPAFLLVTAPAPPKEQPKRTAAVRNVTTIKRVVRVEREPAAAAPVSAEPSARPEAPAPAPAQPTPVQRSAPKRVARMPKRDAGGGRQQTAPQRTPPAAQQPTVVETEPGADTSTPVSEPQTAADGASNRSFAG